MPRLIRKENIRSIKINIWLLILVSDCYLGIIIKRFRNILGFSGFKQVNKMRLLWSFHASIAQLDKDI